MKSTTYPVKLMAAAALILLMSACLPVRNTSKTYRSDLQEAKVWWKLLKKNGYEPDLRYGEGVDQVLNLIRYEDALNGYGYYKYAYSFGEADNPDLDISYEDAVNNATIKLALSLGYYYQFPEYPVINIHGEDITDLMFEASGYFYEIFPELIRRAEVVMRIHIPGDYDNHSVAVVAMDIDYFDNYIINMTKDSLLSRMEGVLHLMN